MESNIKDFWLLWTIYPSRSCTDFCPKFCSSFWTYAKKC